MSTICGVGIDVSARDLTVSVASKTTQSFENNAKGHRAISRLVLRCAKGDVQICVEATGSYSLDLCFHLQSCGLRVMVANPRAVSNFAKAMMSRSKTDPMDAEVLREFAERMPFVEWVPPAQAALERRAASRRLHSLSNMGTREKNRLPDRLMSAPWARATETTISIVSDDLKSSIKHLQGPMERLIKKIESVIKTSAVVACTLSPTTNGSRHRCPQRHSPLRRARHDASRYESQAVRGSRRSRPAAASVGFFHRPAGPDLKARQWIFTVCSIYARRRCFSARPHHHRLL